MKRWPREKSRERKHARQRDLASQRDLARLAFFGAAKEMRQAQSVGLHSSGSGHALALSPHLVKCRCPDTAMEPRRCNELISARDARWLTLTRPDTAASNNLQRRQPCVPLTGDFLFCYGHLVAFSTPVVARSTLSPSLPSCADSAARLRVAIKAPFRATFLLSAGPRLDWNQGKSRSREQMNTERGRLLVHTRGSGTDTSSWWDAGQITFVPTNEQT